MGYNLKKSLITLFLITLILLINIVSSLAVNRETIKRNTDEQDDEWIAKQKPNVADLAFNSDAGDYLEKLATLFSPRYRSGRWSASSLNSVIPEKRQIRYHQCYFNPISCFRRRK
uniref:Uncharacterized protein n=1 Tax=Tetranychus urticae TaxID=32264 RepID=T1KW26_TETUR